MASQTVSSTFRKFGQVRAAIARSGTWNPNAFRATASRQIQTNTQTGATDAVKRGINDAIRTGENMKNNAASATEHAADKTREAVQGVAEKAKQAAQEAWASAKETAQRAKDTALGEAQESKESLKETAEMASRSMNTKNNPN